MEARAKLIDIAAFLDRIDRASGASEAISKESYGREDFRIGEVVAWVFANEPEYLGYRIK